eukprot:777194-Pleurochrysis_carterae.AAC.1
MATPAGEQGRGRGTVGAVTGRADGRCGPDVLRRSGGGSIGSTRPVDLEDLEEGVPGSARSALSSRASEPVG